MPLNYKIPKRYLPRNLSRRDRKTQRRQLLTSRRNYLRGKFSTRKKLPSFTSHVSPHITRALRKYHIKSMSQLRLLSRKSGCSLSALHAILRKGRGAYYSSGSRPNQTAESWARARLASALTGGPASHVDSKILIRGCHGAPSEATVARSASR
jgi:hypothetical protein